MKAILFALAPAVTVRAVSLAIFGGIANATDGLELSGQINRAIMFADDGTQSKGLFVDDSSSGSHLRMKGTKEVRSGLQAGFFT